jgi:hypothetical protein
VGNDDFIVGDDGYKDYGDDEDEYEEDENGVERQSKRKKGGVTMKSLQTFFSNTGSKKPS